MSSSSCSLEELCRSAVIALRNADINFLAIDFDHTFIDEHTGGSFKGNSIQLGHKIREVFRYLVPLAFQNGLFIAIVTFSPQVELIRNTLLQEFPDFGSRIAIRGNDSSWIRPEQDKGGKMAHISDAAEEIKSNFQTNITVKNSILIDDDSDNIEIALNNKTKAILYIPEHPNSERKLLEDIIMLLSPR